MSTKIVTASRGVVRGALVKPNPVIIERVKISMENLEEELLKVVEEKGKIVEESEAKRIFEEIRKFGFLE